MMIDFYKTFCPTEEQIQKSEEVLNKLEQEGIENHHCIYCKHAILLKRYEHGHDAGHDPWCDMYDPPEYCYLLNRDGQICLFWEYDPMENRLKGDEYEAS